MAFGDWKINVNVDGMPQKVATAMGKLSETLVGAEYAPIAYLGEQQVNGINHAVLAEQVIVTGRDTKNVVLVIFNEKPGDVELTLVSIERVVEGGGPLGGVQVDVKTRDVCIAGEEAEAWTNAFSGYVGASVEPFALLGKQMVKGVNYIFAATLTPVVPEPVSKVVIVTINPMIGTLSFADIMTDKHEASLGYAFTWLKGGLGKPLGEWP